MTTPSVKCLIVDDLPENLLALAALLAAPGVEVLQARSGVQALELLLVEPVALAIVDVQMPNMSGFELAELMRGSERTRDVPIIFVTAALDDERRRFRGYESGAVDFLHKPIEAHVLRSKAKIFFQLYRQKLQLADDLRERSDTLRMNELFTAMLGHDLRGPLAAIVMSTLVLEKKCEDESLRRLAERALRSARTMGRMIDDLLDLSRARLGGGIVVHRVEADLEPVVRQVAEEASAGQRQERIALAVEGDLAGEWDSDRIAQVASNLVRNALHHGDADRPVQVHLDGGARDAVVLSVASEGRIPAELLPHLFDPFRGRSGASRGEGLGIGLFIVRQIVTAHGGEVEVDSGDDGRTVFSVRLPRHAGIGGARHSAPASAQ